MKKSLQKFLICLGILILFTILYFLSFNIDLSFLTTVYTYKGIFLIIIFSLLLVISLLLLKKFLLHHLDFKDIVITILIFTSVHLFVFCMVPVTVERSFSVFMLSEMSKQDNQTLDLASTENLFIDKYVKDNSAFEKRFQEQLSTGTIIQTDSDTYQLTAKGNFIVSLFNFFDKLYNVNSPLLK